MRRQWSRVCGTAAVIAGLSAGTVAQATASSLRSPWDVQRVTVTDAPYACPSLPTLPKDITATSYYSDAKKSVIDEAKKEAYDDAKAPFSQVSSKTAAAADAFRKTGSKAAAACVVSSLLQQAKADAMTGAMSSNQANYVQNWTIGALAVAWLKVREAKPATPEQLAVIDPWMKTVAKQVEAWFDERGRKPTTDSQNNHHYWAGFAVMAVGIAVDDRGLYNWGEGTYKDGVSRIDADGTLPLEMNRGQKALHYHLFALAPLVTMAEFGTVNGDDLYAYDHNKLHLLVTRTLAGVYDNTWFAKKAGVAQDTPGKSGLKSDEIWWVAPYQRRFPDPKIAALLEKTPRSPYLYLGGLPPA